MSRAQREIMARYKSAALLIRNNAGEIAIMKVMAWQKATQCAGILSEEVTRNAASIVALNLASMALARNVRRR